MMDGMSAAVSRRWPVLLLQRCCLECRATHKAVSRDAIDMYMEEMKKLAESVAELISENLGLEKGYLKAAFSGSAGSPFMGKFAKYPACPNTERVNGLRAHTDAGGIIFLLQDENVPGLQFFKDGMWVDIDPRPGFIFINLGDQVEVISNGKYKSILHRVLARNDGNRLSIATFYNPAGDAVITPAEKAMYPENYQFGDYLKMYATTKFSAKEPRLEMMKTHVA